MNEEELKEKAQELTIKNITNGKSKYYCWGFHTGCVVGLEYNNNRIEELEKENAELKTIKIPQLERRIASIRGAHSVDCKKLNARIEQVERLKQENAELKKENQKWKDGIALKDEEIGCIETDFNTFKSKAKELLERLLITSCNSDVLNLLPNCSEVLRVRVEAEQFLSEVEK